MLILSSDEWTCNITVGADIYIHSADRKYSHEKNANKNKCQ